MYYSLFRVANPIANCQVIIRLAAPVLIIKFYLMHFPIYIQRLKQGIYILHLRIGMKVITKKIIVIH